MGLSEYRRKRNFRVTGEPRGGPVKPRKRRSFVIQKHAATHLHYDFRLELDGVLKSWAVPKGPSLDPANKRLAMQVEDHPLEYGDFEGVIREGEYGGGTVLSWDKGTWEPVEDGERGYRDGALKFILHGEKLQGKWMLVRRGGKRADASERHWFLFKERDEFAKPGSDIAAELPLSITTGRDLDEIASQADRVWSPAGEVRGKSRSNRTSKATRSNKTPSPKVLRKSKLKGKSTASRKATIAKVIKGVDGKPAPFPKHAQVQLATLAKNIPDSDDWMHEIKFDGYRMLCQINAGKVRFISRNGKDWTKNFVELSRKAAELPVDNGILDGEVVVVDPDGRTSFQALQNAFETGKAPFLFYAFDLLYLNGLDFRDVAIEERKSVLRAVIPDGEESPIKYSDHVMGNGATMFAEAARLKLEGIVSKRLGRPYTGRRSLDWLKVKCSLREEFVIGGFTKPGGGRRYFGALAIGYYDRGGEFIYAGRVGTGFNEATLASLHTKFKDLVQKESPFKNLSGNTGQAKGVTWLKPSLIAQVEFSNWTDDGQLRHPSFQGLREDKKAKEIVRDDPISPTTIASSEKAAAIPRRKPKSVALGAPRSPRRAQTTNVATAVAGVHLSHPDKILYPEDNITKLDLARYYEQVADWMLPHVENRLLSLVRCPGGSGQKCFYQKHPGNGTSDDLRRFDVQEKNKVEEHLALYDLPGLVSLVQIGVLEIHIWGSQADNYEKPDRLIFDLDPDPAVDWPAVVTAAKEVRLLLEELGLVSLIKTTGGKGLHVVVPVQRRTNWDDAKTFCRAVADFMVAAAPSRYVAKMSKAARKGKIFVDYLRNDLGSTAIAPYSTRNRVGASVSVPITWDELSSRLKSDHFNIRNLPARLAKLKKDPWADITKTKQSITASMLKKLQLR